MSEDANTPAEHVILVRDIWSKLQNARRGRRHDVRLKLRLSSRSLHNLQKLTVDGWREAGFSVQDDTDLVHPRSDTVTVFRSALEQRLNVQIELDPTLPDNVPEIEELQTASPDPGGLDSGPG